MLYAFVCDVCGDHEDRLRSVADRDDPVTCEPCTEECLDEVFMRREISAPSVHYKGAGWTRTPAIMSDPIAKGHPGARSNWGVGTVADYGDPNVLSPYKKVVDETVSSDGEA